MAFTVRADAFKSVWAKLYPSDKFIIDKINEQNCKSVLINPRAVKSVILDSGEGWETFLTGYAIMKLQKEQTAVIGTQYRISARDLNKILQTFNDLVDEGQSEHVPYEEWKALKKCTSDPNETVYYWKNLDTDVGGYYFCISNFCFHANSLPHQFLKLLLLTPDTKPNSTTKTEKENKTMNMPTMKFDFGPVNSNTISLSPYGMAVIAPNGTALAYNSATGQTIDVTGFTFDFKGMIYKVPTAVNQIKTGDMIMHNDKPMYVIDNDGTNIDAIDILESEAKIIIPITNMFGFNFVTKVVSFLNFGNTTPSPDQPFGNLMPIMIASMVFGDDKGESLFSSKDMDFGKMMMLSRLLNGNTGANPFDNLFNFGANLPASTDEDSQ